MKDNFIKGFLYKEIYRNEINGYMVGLFKIKDNNIDYDDDMIHITGILPRLSEKKEYILYGEIVYHNKYGKQFNVNSFEVNKEGNMLELELKYGENKKERVIVGLKRISKPGLRVYVKHEELPRVLNGLGIAIISTSKGIMTDKKARENGLGGEVLAYIW